MTEDFVGEEQDIDAEDIVEAEELILIDPLDEVGAEDAIGDLVFDEAAVIDDPVVETIIAARVEEDIDAVQARLSAEAEPPTTAATSVTDESRRADEPPTEVRSVERVADLPPAPKIEVTPTPQDQPPAATGESTAPEGVAAVEVAPVEGAPSVESPSAPLTGEERSAPGPLPTQPLERPEVAQPQEAGIGDEGLDAPMGLDGSSGGLPGVGEDLPGSGLPGTGEDPLGGMPTGGGLMGGVIDEDLGIGIPGGDLSGGLEGETSAGGAPVGEMPGGGLFGGGGLSGGVAPGGSGGGGGGFGGGGSGGGSPGGGSGSGSGQGLGGMGMPGGTGQDGFGSSIDEGDGWSGSGGGLADGSDGGMAGEGGGMGTDVGDLVGEAVGAANTAVTETQVDAALGMAEAAEGLRGQAAGYDAAADAAQTAAAGIQESMGAMTAAGLTPDEGMMGAFNDAMGDVAENRTAAAALRAGADSLDSGAAAATAIPGDNQGTGSGETEGGDNKGAEGSDTGSEDKEDDKKEGDKKEDDEGSGSGGSDNSDDSDDDDDNNKDKDDDKDKDDSSDSGEADLTPREEEEQKPTTVSEEDIDRSTSGEMVSKTGPAHGGPMGQSAVDQSKTPAGVTDPSHEDWGGGTDGGIRFRQHLVTDPAEPDAGKSTAMADEELSTADPELLDKSKGRQRKE